MQRLWAAPLFALIACTPGAVGGSTADAGASAADAGVADDGAMSASADANPTGAADAADPCAPIDGVT